MQRGEGQTAHENQYKVEDPYVRLPAAFLTHTYICQKVGQELVCHCLHESSVCCIEGHTTVRKVRNLLLRV
jgi:hypothetical protein